VASQKTRRETPGLFLSTELAWLEMLEVHNVNFISEFQKMQAEVHRNARDKGWWDDDMPSDDGTKISLMHSELSEALEAMRNGNPVSDKIGPLSNLVEELADVVIRVMDYAEARDLPLALAILKKHQYNTGRDHKHGGKALPGRSGALRLHSPLRTVRDSFPSHGSSTCKGSLWWGSRN